MTGLIEVKTGGSVDSLLSVELQGPISREQWARLVVLCREPSGRFSRQCSLDLPEKTTHWTASFAALPNGNALCGVSDFKRVYELESLRATNGRGAQYNLKEYELPGVYNNICDFRVGGEWRLAVCFIDNSLRVFTLSANGHSMSEVCRLPTFSNGLQPRDILALPHGALCVLSFKKNSGYSKSSSLIDYVEFDPRGNILASRRLLEHYGNLILLNIQGLTSKVTLVTRDGETQDLRLYEFID